MIKTVLFTIGTIIKILGIILLSLYPLLGSKKFIKIFFGSLKNLFNKVDKPIGGFGTQEYLERLPILPGLICIILGEILTSIAFFDVSIDFKIDTFFIIIFVILISTMLVFLYCVRKNKIKEFKSILTLLAVILALFSAFYAYQTIDWYQNPKPLILTWTSADTDVKTDGFYSIPNNTHYNPELGVQSFVGDSLSSRKIDFWVHNAGRKPITGNYIKVRFCNITNNQYDFPFRVVDINTSVNSLHYNNGEITWNEQINFFYNKHNVADFVPNENTLVPNFSLPPVGPDETIKFTIYLFSIEKNVQGEVTIDVIDNDDNVYHFTPVIIHS